MELLGYRFCTCNFMKYCQMALQNGLSVVHSMKNGIVLIAPYSHQLLILSDFSVFVNLMSVDWYIATLIYISLLISEIDYYIRCLLVIWLSSSINFLLTSFIQFLMDSLSFPYHSYLCLTSSSRLSASLVKSQGFCHSFN